MKSKGCEQRDGDDDGADSKCQRSGCRHIRERPGPGLDR